jgi:hypothetical protein
MELTELNDLLRDNLLLAIAATADNPDLVLPDNWLELVEAWEAEIATAHWNARWDVIG